LTAKRRHTGDNFENCVGKEKLVKRSMRLYSSEKHSAHQNETQSIKSSRGEVDFSSFVSFKGVEEKQQIKVEMRKPKKPLSAYIYFS